MTVTALHPARMAAAARGDLAERMTYVAEGLARMVRDEAPDAIGEFLDTLTPEETRALVIVQAAMIPADTGREQLLDWVTWDEFGYPLPGAAPAQAALPGLDAVDQRAYEDCGTSTAYWRHKRAGHPKQLLEVCGCAQAGRDYFNDRLAGQQARPKSGRAPASQVEGRIAEYARLREQGESLEAAAARLGIVRRTAYRYEARLRAAQEEADRAA